ncbi:MAG TPA: hypothetical protein VII66_04520 [Gemmatimonadaceae bacterium]
MATRAARRINYGSVEITEERAVYTDSDGVRWRLYDFAQEKGGRKIAVRVGSISASVRIYVRQDGRHRRCVVFSHRDDTLTPEFNYISLPTAMVQRLGRWVHASNEDESRNTNHPLAKSRLH